MKPFSLRHGWAFLAAALSFIEPSISGAQATSLRVGTNSPASTEAVLFSIAKDAGILKQHQLDAEVIYIAGGTLSMQALVGRSLDFMCTGGTPFIYAYLEGVQGKIIGGKAPSSSDVYAASRGTDPISGELTSEEVEVQDRGVITTFCVVNIPGLSELAPEIPYVSAQILLDGANNMMFGLIRGIEVDDVRMGMRVQAKWADELKPDHTSILWWTPTGEPDEDYARYKDYL